MVAPGEIKIMNTNLAYAVVDCESSPITVLARFASEQEASEWIGKQADHDKVLRGGYGIDGPDEG